MPDDKFAINRLIKFVSMIKPYHNMNQFFDFLAIKQVIMIGVVFLEDIIDCLLNLISGITQFVVLGVSLVLLELTVKSSETFLVFAEV